MYVATAVELERVGGKYYSDNNEATPKPFAVDPEVCYWHSLVSPVV